LLGAHQTGTVRFVNDGDEHAICESEERLRFVANAIPPLIAYVGADVRYVWVNESYRRWFGYAPDTLRGVHARDVLGAAAWARLQAYVERVLRGEEVTFEDRVVYKNGPVRHVRASYIPHLDASGRVLGFAVTANDITEIRAAEIALRRTEQMLERSQSTAHVGSWELALKDGVPVPGALKWTDETYRIYGLEPQSVGDLQRIAVSAVHPEDRERVRTDVPETTERVQPLEREYRIVRPDGTVRTVHEWIHVDTDERGRPIRMMGTCQDVTERHRAEQELREVARRKDEFLAMLSHELRNPLAPILSAVAILDRAPHDDDALAARYREVIARQVRHMKRLLDDLLDVSRVRQGKIHLQKEPVDLGALLLQAVEMSRPLIAEKRQQLSLALEGSQLSVDADPTRLIQVFANLLNNAAKYTDDGGHITLGARSEAAEAVVSVRDDGMGMSPDLLVRAFDLFAQDTRTIDRAQGGLGIGLTLARTLVTMHGGSLRAVSEGPGRGSEFVVRLPLSARSAAVVTREASAPADAGTGPALRVLVVDDNTDITQALQDLLALLGHQVRVARDGPGALAAATEVRPDLILLDIGLPGMDGYEVAKRLRKQGHDRAALVALTGYGRDEDLRRSRSAGFDRYLVKPVDVADLYGLIADVSLRTATQALR